MPRKLPPYCEAWRDRHGKLRVYFRRTKNDPRVVLPGSIGSDEFLAAYQAALAGMAPKPKASAIGPARDTMAGLIASYRKSPEYRSLRQTSKTGYSSRLAMLENEHGKRGVSGLTRERIVKGIMTPYADRPGAALANLKMLRVLIRHAIAIGWLKSDPSTGIKRPKTEEIRAWTEQEIAVFEERWPVGTKQRLAFALMLYSGQRRSDVHRMTWSDVSGGAIKVVQQKTGAKLDLPLHSHLAKILAKTERKHLVIVATEYGKPFTVDGFGGFMRDAIRAAGLPLECQPHGLRKAAGRRLAEAGCSANEIMSVLGHKTLAEAERYTREASQKLLAAAAVTRMDGQVRNKVPQTASDRVGKKPKTTRRTEL